MITILRIEFQMQPSGVMATLNEELEGRVRIELDNAIHAGNNEWLEFLTVTTISNTDLEPRLSELPHLEFLNATALTDKSTTYYVLLLAQEPEQFFLETLATNRVIPHRVCIEENRLKATVSVRDWDHLKDFADEIESEYGSFELIGTTQIDGLSYPLGSDRLKYTVSGKLTEDQLAALETSFQMGYYTVPQRATSEEVAERLDISQSTLSTKLRRAQHNLLEILFGESSEGWEE